MYGAIDAHNESTKAAGIAIINKSLSFIHSSTLVVIFIESSNLNPGILFSFILVFSNDFFSSSIFVHIVTSQ